MSSKGTLIDHLYHPDVSFEVRREMIGKIQACLNTSLGREMMQVLDQIVTPKVMDYAKLSDPDVAGALIAQEAERYFFQQLKMLARYDERSDPGNPARNSGTRRPS